MTNRVTSVQAGALPPAAVPAAARAGVQAAALSTGLGRPAADPPTRFTIPPESEYPLTALNVRRVTALPSRASTEFELTHRWEWTTVAGRRAVRFETSSTGAGMDQAGTRRYGYALRLGHSLISVHTIAEPHETRYPAWKTVVNKAVRTLTAAPPPAGPCGCVSIRPATGFYEAGSVAIEELTAPRSRCSTVSVSHVADPANDVDYIDPQIQTVRFKVWH